MIWGDDYRYGKLFEYIRKSYFVGRDEYARTINGGYELLVCTSRPFIWNILKVRSNFSRNECGHGGRTSVMFMQTRVKQ